MSCFENKSKIRHLEIGKNIHKLMQKLKIWNHNNLQHLINLATCKFVNSTYHKMYSLNLFTSFLNRKLKENNNICQNTSFDSQNYQLF